MQTGRKHAVRGSVLALALAIVAVLLFLRAEAVHIDLIYKVLSWPLAELMAGFLLFWAAALTWLFLRRWDATTRQKAALEEVIYSVSPDTLVVIDSRRHIVRCNESLERVFGYRPHEVIGKPTEMLYSDRRSDPAHPGEIREAMERDGYHVGLATGQTKDGRAVPLEIITAPLSRHPGAVLVLRDISDRLKAQRRRRRVEARMQRYQKTESLGILADTLGRQFQSRVDTISESVAAAMAHAADDSDVAENLRKIQRVGEHSTGLCRELRTYAGGSQEEFKTVLPGSVVLDIGQLLEVALPKKAVLKFDLPPDVPAVEADIAQLHQVVMNLITNAGDALGEERGMITISAGAAWFDADGIAATDAVDDLAEGRYVFLRVADTGCGMNEETRRRIFDPFYTTKKTGRGLGLASVLGIIRRHQGTLLVESRPGEGTVFTVLLPAAGEMFSRPPSETDPPSWRTRGTVVVGVDDKSLRMRIARQLVRLGYAVAASAGGYMASGTCREHVGGISAVMIDTAIPPYSARDAFNSIVDMRRGIAMVLISSHSEEEVMAEYAASCCAGFLHKPFTEEQLGEVIEKACLNAGPRL